LAELNTILTSNPTFGRSLGNNVYKIRVAIKSKGTGKSCGERGIACIVTKNKEIYLLIIYDIIEIETIDDTTLRKIIQGIKNEL
jgi:hypothetical protein